MTLQEYAKVLAEKMKNKPTKSTVIETVNDILSKHLSNNQIKALINYLEDELENYSVFNESYENSETLSLIAQVKELLCQAQNGGKK